MSDDTYTPPSVWTWDTESGGNWAKINRPVSGATHEKELPRGNHSLQLYSLATPNGQKVTIMLEELLQAGISQAEYDAYAVQISEGEQFGSGFVSINPNSKIPALVDYSESEPVRVFESGAILLYLAEKFSQFIPVEHKARTETLSWLFWQMGSGPFLGGGFGHFYAYAPEKWRYPIDRYAMEVKRQLDVLDKQLNDNEYIAGNDYTIADIAIWPWYGALVLGKLYNTAEFLDVTSYRNVVRWAEQVAQRKAVRRGKIVNKTWGKVQLAERHSASDLELNIEN